MYYILFYDYCENVLERRTPFRAAHLELAREALDRGELVMAGAFADPVDGAAFIFNVSDPAAVEAFVSRDPYVANGIVTSWRIRAWTVAIGGAKPA